VYAVGGIFTNISQGWNSSFKRSQRSSQRFDYPKMLTPKHKETSDSCCNVRHAPGLVTVPQPEPTPNKATPTTHQRLRGEPAEQLASSERRLVTLQTPGKLFYMGLQCRQEAVNAVSRGKPFFSPSFSSLVPDSGLGGEDSISLPQADVVPRCPIHQQLSSAAKLRTKQSKLSRAMFLFAFLSRQSSWDRGVFEASLGGKLGFKN
jgi:hypothetical protein